MKKLLLLFTIVNYFTFAQMPETADSIYWSTKFCDTAETIEDHLAQWTWNGNFADCMNPSEGLVNAFYDEESGEVLLYLLDTYECCCQIASTPGSIGAWTFFYGSSCQEHLDSIGFIYDDPKFVNWTSIKENNTKELDEVYIDIYGRRYHTQPDGLSIMNRRIYFKIK